MPEKSKVPPRVVSSDDFVVDVDGVLYYPHAGETVTFRSRFTPDELVRCSRLRGIDLQAPPDELEANLGEIREVLADRIVSTTWTNDNGEAVQPTAEGLEGLDFAELGWLFARMMPTQAASGEASAPSTEASVE